MAGFRVFRFHFEGPTWFPSKFQEQNRTELETYTISPKVGQLVQSKLCKLDCKIGQFRT